MSFAHELRVLDIGSQIEFLERLRLLTQFGSNVIRISGEKGSGKSWIAQRYLEAWAQDKNQSLLMCHPNQTDTQRRTTILNQIITDPLFNENDSISDSFSRMMEGKECDIVIVIDDAYLLGEAILAELWVLVTQAQAKSEWNINVILFTMDNRLDEMLSRLSYGQETKPLFLEIESLSKEEVETFMQLLVLKYVSGEEEKNRVRRKASRTLPLPGALIALGESKIERRIIIRSIVGSPIKITALIMTAIFIIGIGYMLVLDQLSPSMSEQVEKTIEQTVIPITDTEIDKSDTDDVSKVREEIEQKAVKQEEIGVSVNVDTSPLPPIATHHSVTVGKLDEETQRDIQSIDVPSTIVDTLLANDKYETQIAENDVDTLELDIQGQLKKEPPVIETDFERDENTLPLITFSFSKQELMAVPDHHYTLQIAARQSLNEIQDFITKYDINKNNIRIYPAYRDDALWFIVTYKDFETIQAARDARAELSLEVQKLQPWAKSMLQVHREILRAN